MGMWGPSGRLQESWSWESLGALNFPLSQTKSWIVKDTSPICGASAGHQPWPTISESQSLHPSHRVLFLLIIQMLGPAPESNSGGLGRPKNLDLSAASKGTSGPLGTSSSVMRAGLPHYQAPFLRILEDTTSHSTLPIPLPSLLLSWLSLSPHCYVC